MRWAIPAAVGLAMLISRAAVAQEEPPRIAAPAPASGVEIGVRLAYGFANGGLMRGYSLVERVTGQVPLQLDLGYRLSPELYAGIYGQYGAGLTTGCARSSCSAQDYRLGIEALYHFGPRAELDPWIGLGVGYEWLHTRTEAYGGAGFPLTIVDTFRRQPPVDVVTGASSQGHLASTLQRGPEANAQIGVDWRLAKRLWVGPFAACSIGQYVHNWHDIDGVVEGADIADKTFHEWFFVGLRGTTDVMGPH
jgi:hypothetical protein